MTDKVTETATSSRTAEALLKQAVAGAKAKVAALPSPKKRLMALDARLAAVAGAALTLGLAVGAGGMVLASRTGDRASETLTQIQSRLDTRHSDLARLQGEIERMGKALAQVQETTDAVRSDAKSRVSTLTDRIAKAEQAIVAKVTSLADRQDQTERDQSAKIAALTTQLEKRPAPPAPAPAPQAAKVSPPEPTETGSIPEKAKPATVDNWAVREVYNGIAVIEDRKHRLVEIGQGDIVPGVGRVDAIERKGRAWVVVTKQGLITSQTW